MSGHDLDPFFVRAPDGRYYDVGPEIGLTEPMVSKGTAARKVLYDYDFVQGTSQLNQHGKDRVAMMAGLVANTPYPVVGERTSGRA